MLPNHETAMVNEHGFFRSIILFAECLPPNGSERWVGMSLSWKNVNTKYRFWIYTLLNGRVLGSINVVLTVQWRFCRGMGKRWVNSPPSPSLDISALLIMHLHTGDGSFLSLVLIWKKIIVSIILRLSEQNRKTLKRSKKTHTKCSAYTV